MEYGPQDAAVVVELLEKLADGDTVVLGEFTGGEYVLPSDADVAAEMLREIALTMRRTYKLE